MKFKILELFAGVGGLSYGFRNDNFEILLANDIWEPAKETYTYNHPNTKFILDDIANIKKETIKEHISDGVDIIIGGPPCQGFSMCGVRDICDDRNKLFLEYARIVKETEPYLFIIENVKGLLSMKNPNGDYVIDEMYKEFEKLGYVLKHKVLDSSNYEVPQARERVIIVGTHKKIENNYSFPKKSNFTFTVRDALNGIPNENSNEGKLTYQYDDSNHYTKYFRSQSGKIFNHKAANHGEPVINRMSYVPQGGNWQNIPEEYRVGGIHSNAYRRLEMDKPSITIKHAFKSMIIHPVFNRCLTIREVARLQSFKDDFIFKGNKTSQYQQLANAVPPKLSEFLALSVLNYFNKNNIKPKKKKVNNEKGYKEYAI